MRCPFCYSYATRTEVYFEMTDIAPYLRFVELNSKQIDSINWGTGENSLSSKWYELIMKIRELAPHILQAVTTNGYLGYIVSQESLYLSAFRKCIDDIDVSLDFSKKETHNSFRGNPDAFDWALKTLELCVAMGKPRTIVMIGCKKTLNVENVSGLLEIARFFDANFRINILRPVSGVSLDPVKYRHLKPVLRYIVQSHDVVSLGDPLFASVFGQSYLDPTGVRSLRILPDGSITPSTYLVSKRWRAKNILQEPVVFDDLVQTEPFGVLRSTCIPNECRECRLRDSCLGGAKDRRQIWYGTLEARDPYCPLRHDGDLNWLNGFNVRSVRPVGPLVHEGYLPTLIFRPSSMV